MSAPSRAMARTAAPALAAVLTLAGALVGLAGAAGCGYVFAARPALPGGVDRVSVPLLEANVSDPEASAVMTRCLADRAEQDDRLATGGKSARIVGRIVRIRVGATAFPGTISGAGLYSLSMALALRLVPADGGKPLRQVRVSGDEPFAAGVNPVDTESNRRRALDRLARRLADEAWRAMTAPARKR